MFGTGACHGCSDGIFGGLEGATEVGVGGGAGEVVVVGGGVVGAV